MKNKCVGGSSGFYGLAFLGALVYFLQQATNFTGVIVAIFKAIFWPALLIYKLLGFYGL